MKRHQRERGCFLLGLLGTLTLPLVSQAFFPPFDLYPRPPQRNPIIEQPIIEQPVPPVPEIPIPPVVLPPVVPPPIVEEPPPAIPQVPEPTTVVLALVGLGSMLCFRGKRKPDAPQG